jgi:hydroxypyruvate reductase
MRGVEATSAVLDLLSNSEETDLVICLISGGASALLTHPIIPLDDWQQLITALLESGCTISELNTVRRQIDLVKGGGLLKHAAPAICVSLILSDVVGNPLEVIGSGPTVQFQESPEDARAVMKRYRITRHLPREVWGRIDEALNNLQQERPVGTVKVNNIIIGDVCQAAMASEVAAQELGFQTQLLTCTLEGEARDVGTAAAALARDLYPGSCLVLGGETTVTVKGKGIGGRNQELALAAAIAMEGLENVVVASFATDGEDGLTKAAGAAVTGSSASSARLRGLDPQALLDKNDSFSFFSRLGGLLETGSTGTNVNDLLFILKYES